jgi:hypothetical protein
MTLGDLPRTLTGDPVLLLGKVSALDLRYHGLEVQVRLSPVCSPWTRSKQPPLSDITALFLPDRPRPR